MKITVFSDTLYAALGKPYPELYSPLYEERDENLVEVPASYMRKWVLSHGWDDFDKFLDEYIADDVEALPDDLVKDGILQQDTDLSGKPVYTLYNNAGVLCGVFSNPEKLLATIEARPDDYPFDLKFLRHCLEDETVFVKGLGSAKVEVFALNFDRANASYFG